MPLSTVGTGREDVTTTPWPVPQERRTLTVLFADIVGSTALTERLDPEDVRAVQFAYFDTVAGVLRRWQGTVEKYVGDAVMALFGARTSDGLDGYRAVRAALEIQAALDRRELPGGVTLRVRVGVATGEAVVDLAAARDGGHGMASGAVLTTAARIQEYAPPGGVVVCAATHRATAGLIDQHALAPAALTGKALPVDVWRVTGPTPPRPTRHDGPLIGRRREVATAVDQLIRAAREHRPRWVALVGPDGIGRSRLLAELRHRLPTVDGRPVRWAVVHCPPYPERVFGPVAELLRDLLGPSATEGTDTVRARLATLVDGLVPPGQVAATVAALAALLDAPDRAAVAGAAAVRRVLLALAARRPVVVGVDDLDRAAPELGHFLHSLFAAATARGLPLAVLATHRPDRADPHLTPTDRHHRVELTPLSTLHTGRLLRRLLTRAGRPVAAAARLVPLVAGRPGHATAYVHASVRPTGPDAVGGVADTGARGTPYPLTGRPAGPPLPEPLRRRAAALLDRCDGPHRAVLMAAATLDVEFAASSVDVLLGWAAGRAARALRRLTDAGLVRSGAHGGHVIVDPALRRCAYDRLPRAVRAEFTQRAEAIRPAGTARQAGTALRTGTSHRTGTGRSVMAIRPGTDPEPGAATGSSSPSGGSGQRTAAGGAVPGHDPRRCAAGIDEPRRSAAAGIDDPRRCGLLPVFPLPGVEEPRPTFAVCDADGPRPVFALPDAHGPRREFGAAGGGGNAPTGPVPRAGVGRTRGGSIPDGRWAETRGGHRPVDPGSARTGGVVVPLPSRGAGVPTGHGPAAGGRRRRGEGVPRPAVPLPARAA
ncbi:adenylate/guanylate cyclase domain-containing protein [Micromonospora matsumotoense]|uniref:adenylate/guanylate cyclase domain-containing protein n=1 Tax=Micromonospora matsumotoense TaxID=121616 RepID=UPI00340D5C2B